MPKHSTIYVYGALSGGNPEGLSLVSLLFEGKTCGGYWLSKELGLRKPEESAALFGKVPAMLRNAF
jgi:hypothetical protein